MQRKTVHEIVPFRFPLLLSSNGRSGIKREHSEGSYHDNDDDDDDDDEDDEEDDHDHDDHDDHDHDDDHHHEKTSNDVLRPIFLSPIFNFCVISYICGYYHI